MNKKWREYEKYISSPGWGRKRKERLFIDKHRCRTCGLSHEEGTSLEVHHVSYENFGDEPMSDLITLCRQCHEAITNVIRHRRYTKNVKSHFAVEAERTRSNENARQYDRNNFDWHGTLTDAQRPISRPPERGGQGNEKDFWEAF